MKLTTVKVKTRQDGMALPLVLMTMVILISLGVGLLAVSYGVRHAAIQEKNETICRLAAEAGYERAIFWMSQQEDLMYVMKSGGELTASLDLGASNCLVEVSFHSFQNSRPAYRVLATSSAGHFTRAVDVVVLQEISGWDMGRCRVPNGSSSTDEVYFADNEIIDMPLHINDAKDSPDNRDIFITGSPSFLEEVSMGESRYVSGGSDKYAGVLGCFQDGIEFDQPSNCITDEDVVVRKIESFKDSTKNGYKLTPAATAAIPNAVPAVQLEFFVNNGVGKIRLTNCSVRTFQQSSDSRTWDYCIRPGSEGTRFDRYGIYAYHLMSADAVANNERVTRNVANTYVTQELMGIESEPGGQIFVNGNVVIGGDRTEDNGDQIVNGRITVVATGNIWVADSILLDGPHDDNGMPSEDNPNALGLIAQGVIRVVDPGMSDYSYVDGSPIVPAGYEYVPIGRADAGQPADSHKRHLPDPMVVEASITVGGGGWGAENVERGYYGGRKEANGSQDALVLRGTLTEAMRGVVGLVGSDGYVKQYYFDSRMLEGILPGNIWLRNKYVPAPAGWSDYRSSL